jgi:predicted RNA-binding protein YlqC (UPF0109 family)
VLVLVSARLPGSSRALGPLAGRGRAQRFRNGGTETGGPRTAAANMYSNEDHMFGHVGDQLNGLDSRMAGFELDPARSMNMDPGPMINGILANNGSLGVGVGVNESLPGMSVGGAQMGSGAGPSGDMAIKVLVSNKDAGSLIGKNGSTIVSFQALTGSRVRVSRADEPFPGTQERVVLITGSLECVNKCLSLVIEQVHKHFADYPYADKEVQPLDPHAHRTMNLVVPAGASGLIIGRGGDTVRALASKSGTRAEALRFRTRRVLLATPASHLLRRVPHWPYARLCCCVCPVCAVGASQPLFGRLSRVLAHCLD